MSFNASKEKMKKKVVLLFIAFTWGVSVRAADSTNAKVERVLGSLHQIITKNSVADYNKLFFDVLDKIEADYVEKIEEKQLIESAMDGMLSSLDPHSGYLNEEEFAEMKTNTRGEFGGLGIEVMMEKGLLKVISPYEDGPAFNAGVKAGDLITMIEGESVRGMRFTDAVNKLRGKPKTKVKITIFREFSNDMLDMTITRDVVKIIPVKAKLVSNDVGLIKITSFNENAADAVQKEYKRLREQAVKQHSDIRGLVIDLRWNPGGLFDQAREVAELFLEDAMIVSTEGRMPEATQQYKAAGSDITDGLPIVVLMNAGSASASEIVAGALQDNRRALIVGTRSSGKGSVQSVIPLTNGGAIKMTTALYYTPSGKSIQERGIEPDVIVEEAVVTPIKTPGVDAVRESSLTKHLVNKQTKQSPEAIKHESAQFMLEGKEKEDYQLIRAIDIVKGMALYSERLSN